MDQAKDGGDLVKIDNSEPSKSAKPGSKSVANRRESQSQLNQSDNERIQVPNSVERDRKGRSAAVREVYTDHREPVHMQRDHERHMKLHKEKLDAILKRNNFSKRKSTEIDHYNRLQ